MANEEENLELPECDDDFEMEMEPQREHEVLSDERLQKWREFIQTPQNLLGWRSRYKKPDLGSEICLLTRVGKVTK